MKNINYLFKTLSGNYSSLSYSKTYYSQAPNKRGSSFTIFPNFFHPPSGEKQIFTLISKKFYPPRLCRYLCSKKQRGWNSFHILLVYQASLFIRQLREVISNVKDCLFLHVCLFGNTLFEDGKFSIEIFLMLQMVFPEILGQVFQNYLKEKYASLDAFCVSENK